MNIDDLIPLEELCRHYEVEMSFFTGLNDYGLIQITTIEKTYYLPKENIGLLEKMIRMHHELDINFEGIDAVFNLLNKIDDLQNELTAVKNRLRLYENGN